MAILAIDASNLNRGGGVTHICEILKDVEIERTPFDAVYIYGSEALLDKIGDYVWLRKRTHNLLNGSMIKRLVYLSFIFKRHLVKDGVDILFAPGGLYLGSFRPFVTMSRNMLVFEKSEADRYGFSKIRLRLWLLFILQKWTFNRASKVIFLSNYARNYIESLRGVNIRKSEIIHHGVSGRFANTAFKSREIKEFDHKNPFRIVYVSILDVYKHQFSLIKAVAQLRIKGYPVELVLVGGEYSPYGQKVKDLISTFDQEFVTLTGEIPYSEIANWYSEANLFVFASSCENMPNILLEAMSSGIPIACSNRGPMPEFLKDAGVYFDPENANEMTECIENLILDSQKRLLLTQMALFYAKDYSWESCAEQTFKLLKEVIIEKKQIPSDK